MKSPDEYASKAEDALRSPGMYPGGLQSAIVYATLAVASAIAIDTVPAAEEAERLVKLAGGGREA